MPQTGSSFVVLKQVDSTNNYAMAKVHAGMAKHGTAYFTNHQTGGKGQRGKEWITGEGLNIAMSVIVKPNQLNIIHPFQLSAVIALAAVDFFSRYAGDETQIKWPNDLYWRDRKAGGILIENKYSGNNWNWAVIGVGININQRQFETSLKNPVSLMQITGKSFDTALLAIDLHHEILKRLNELLTKSYENIVNEYNLHLYKMQQTVRLRKDNMIFQTLVKGVSPQGQLMTQDTIEKQFEFGEVEWLIE